MIRSFVALEIPAAAAAQLAELRVVMGLEPPSDPVGFHLTLAFLGTQPDQLIEDAHLALARLRAERFDLALAGVGSFGAKAPRVVWAGIRAEPALGRLQARVTNALRGAGLEIDARRFVPHVTLTRLAGGRGGPARDTQRLARMLAAGAGFRTAPWRVEDFVLFRSESGRAGRIYTPMMRYRLGAGTTGSGPAEGRADVDAHDVDARDGGGHDVDRPG